MDAEEGETEGDETPAVNGAATKAPEPAGE
jgi:hypothetical protein